jgi:hypothetical protein
VFGIAKAGGPVTMETLEEEGPLAALWESAQGLLVQVVQRGRELGAMRDDLPDDLLQTLLIAVDVAHDRWLLTQWSELSPTGIDTAAERIADLLQRLLEPK